MMLWSRVARSSDDGAETSDFMERTFVLIDVPVVDAESQDSQRSPHGPCLEHALRMACESLCIDRVVAVTAASVEAGTSSSLASVPTGAQVFTSKRPDALGRLVEAARFFDAPSVFLVDGGQWLLDPVFIDRLLVAADQLNHCDTLHFIAADGNDLSELDAVFPVWCRTSALERADREAYRWLDRQEPGHYLQAHSQRYRAGRLALSERDRLAARRCVTELLNEPWQNVEQLLQSLSAEDWDCRGVAERLQAMAGAAEIR